MNIKTVLRAALSGQKKGLDKEALLRGIEDGLQQEHAAHKSTAAKLSAALGQGVELNQSPDGCGYFYGTLTTGDSVQRLNIMPPLPHWSGDQKLTADVPHATDWIVYLDGEEKARATTIAGLQLGA